MSNSFDNKEIDNKDEELYEIIRNRIPNGEYLVESFLFRQNENLKKKLRTVIFSMGYIDNIQIIENDLEKENDLSEFENHIDEILDEYNIRQEIQAELDAD